MANIEVKDLTSHNIVQREDLLNDSDSFITELSESDQVVGGFFWVFVAAVAGSFLARELLGTSVTVNVNVPLGGGQRGNALAFGDRPDRLDRR